MSFIIPGWQVRVTSGDLFSGLTVGAYGAYFLRVEVQSGGAVIDTGVSITASWAWITDVSSWPKAAELGNAIGRQ